MAEWEDAPRGSSGGWEDAPKKEYGIGDRAKAALKSGLSQVPESISGIGLGLRNFTSINIT